MKWLVLYTKPQHEIRVSNSLNSIGIKAYCPTYKKIVQYSDRKKKVEKPLLPSYVLVYISEQDRQKVFTISGVVRYVFWLGKPAEVRSKEIEDLRNGLQGFIQSFSLKQLKKGANYSITEGPLKGLEGSVVSHAKNKLKLELTGLGMLVTLNLA
ncbi:MAG: antitermination protein NusG [Pelagibacterales bacterium]|nr:antitermination protein NusG [Pelagibacterales bacterium]|tara:strand:+ start:3450 stop:3911 length:462 start_codon:yes stop_codon:yes gene_type:complete